jgi:predicted outer membrane protein
LLASDLTFLRWKTLTPRGLHLLVKVQLQLECMAPPILFRTGTPRKEEMHGPRTGAKQRVSPLNSEEIEMRNVTFPALLALTAFASLAMAQSATETEPSTTTRQTEPSASAPSQTTPGQTTPSAVPGQASSQRQPGQAGQAGQAGGLDQQIAACAVLANQEEVALAQFAKDRAESDQVKQFAEMMIEQHQQAIQKIEQAAPQVAAWKIQLRNANADQQAGAAAQPQANGQAGQNPQFLLARQIHEECLALTKEALSEKQGADFDKAYIAQQCMAHLGMKAAIKGSEPFASQQLKPVLQEGLQMTEKHLTEAKNLKKQLMNEAAGEPRQARAPQ